MYVCSVEVSADLSALSAGRASESCIQEYIMKLVDVRYNELLLDTCSAQVRQTTTL